MTCARIAATQPGDPGAAHTAEDEDEGDLPHHSRLSWSARDGSWVQSAILDFTALAVLGASRLTGFPELGRLFGGEPEALRLNIGAVGELMSPGTRPQAAGDVGQQFGQPRRLGYALQIDLSETLRIHADDAERHPVVAANRIVDAAYVVVGVGGGVRALAGRQPVAASRFQEPPTSVLHAGAPPFIVDRVFPHRRWGLRCKLTSGAIDGSLGAFLDGDEIEARTVPGDPSFGSRALVGATARWTLHGRRELHWLPRVIVALDQEDGEPMWGDPRLALRASALARSGDRTRLDATVGVEASRGRYGGVAEIIASAGDGRHLSIAAESSALLHTKVAVFVRGELDSERDLFSTGAGISYFATLDRRNRLAFYAWLRRDFESAPERDGVIIELQAEL